jgi:hypothetical protein
MPFLTNSPFTGIIVLYLPLYCQFKCFVCSFTLVIQSCVKCLQSESVNLDIITCVSKTRITSINLAHRVDMRTSVMSTRTFRTSSISVIWISEALHFSYYQIVFRWEQWIRGDALCGNTVPNPWSKCQIYGHSAILCLRDLWILCILIILICCRTAAENRGGQWYMISCWYPRIKLFFFQLKKLN